MSESEFNPAALLQRIDQGDIRGLSRAISVIEDGTAGYQKLLGELHRKAGQALRIGITGPPGAGKSTLVNCLAHHYADRDQRVGIIAVDPSSPFTGGALLGDRVRMNEFPPNGKVFFRSMATRGATGGLASATNDAVIALDAFGFDVTLIETVGVGQIELDIIDACDVVVVAIVPESGDAVQTMKAGLMEIANVMVVNKADRPGAESVVAELRQALRLRKSVDGAWRVPVLPAQAMNNVGIDKLTTQIDAFVTHEKDSGGFVLKRRQRIHQMIMNLLTNRFQREFVDGLQAKINLDKLVADIESGQANPYEVADRLYSEHAHGVS